MSSNSSIYIPRLSSGYTFESIKQIMAAYDIGTVTRVDFTPINKKPGFIENIDDNIISAFVHFSDPILCIDGRYHFDTYTKYINNQFWDVINTGQPFRLQINSNEYWICLKNKNPVKKTLMNVHQIVENARFLEILVQSQVSKIEELDRKIEYLNETIYQLRKI